MAAEPDEQVAAFRHRRIDTARPFAFAIVGTYAVTMKAVAMIATGINADGHREALVPAFGAFPKDGRMGQIWSNNPIELLNHQILRRTYDSVGIFPPARPSSICSVPSSRTVVQQLRRPTTPTTVRNTCRVSRDTRQIRSRHHP